MFQVRVFGLDKTIKLNGRKIIVTLEYDYEVRDIIVNEEDDIVVNEQEDYLVSAPTVIDTSENLFTGYIDSSESDIIKTDRNIVAYDRAYTDRDTDIAVWWNNYWSTLGSSTVALSTFRNALLTHMGITYNSTTLLHDSLTITKANMPEVSTLRFADMMYMIFSLQNATPIINGNGVLDFVKIEQNTQNIKGETEGLNSTWKDFVTKKITGVCFYDSSTNLSQLVGTNTNVYNIVGNMLVMDKTGNELETIGTAILNDIKDIQYVPASVNMKISHPEFKLGDKILTDGGDLYIFQNTLSGSLLIEQRLTAGGDEELAKEVSSATDNYSNSMKYDALSKKIVLTVDASGNVGKMELGSNSGGSTFEISADSLNFKANNDLNLTTQNLNIKSTNFELNSSGDMKFKYGLTSMSDTSHSGIYIDTTGIYIRKHGIGYFKATSSGYVSATNLDVDTLTFNSPGGAALVQLSMTDNNSYAKMSNLEISNGLTINSGKSLKYRGTELQSLLDAKKNSSAIHAGTFTCTFSNGSATVPFSTFGVSSRPNGLVVCAQYLGYVVITYMWDSSSSNVILYAWACDTGGGYGEWYSGTFRCSYVCIT